MWAFSICLLYVVLCLLSGFVTSTFGVSVILLDGLTHFYMADEDQIKDPSGAKSGDDGNKGITIKKRNRKKDDDWNETGSKLVRLRMQPIHVMTRQNFKEYDELVMFTTLGLLILLACDLLHRFVYESAMEVVDTGDLVALLFGAMAVWRTVRNTAQVQWDKATTRNMDLQISVLVGIICGCVALVILLLVPTTILDFSFDPAIEDAGKIMAAHLNVKLDDGIEPYPPVDLSPVFVKGLLAVVAGGISALLLPASLRLIRCYHVATSPDERDLRVIDRHWFIRVILHINYLLPVFTLFLWIKPMTSLFTLGKTEDSIERNVADEDDWDWAKNRGVSLATFNQIRLGLLAVSGILQLACFRINMQSYLNLGIVAWYNQLHGSSEPDFDYIKARLGLTTHLLCRVAMQCILPGALPLLLLGLSRCRASHLDAKALAEGFLFPPALLRQVFVFLAWWSNSIWAVETTAILAGFRIGRLQVV